jgi:hypothetical protein
VCAAALLALTSLLFGAHGAAAATADSVGSGNVAATIRPAGAVSAAPHAVNISRLSATAKSATHQPTAAQQAALRAIEQHSGAALPSRPSTGSRPSAPNAARATGANGPTAPHSTALPRSSVVPLAAPSVLANFDGGNQNNSGCDPELCFPGSSIAVGANEIVQTVNTKFVVYDKYGAELCESGLSGFLEGTTDDLSDPRVQYDVATGRYSLVVSAAPAASDVPQPILWIGATTGDDPCAGWTVYRLAFTGLQPDSLLDAPMLGVDQNALLFSTRYFDASGEESPFVFGIPKSAVYSGGAFGGSIFFTSALTAPVSSGGDPMVVSTGFSYFLSAVPGTGYTLYRLTNGGGPGSALTLQATISSPFNAPTRGVNQPGQNVGLSPGYGQIVTPPVNDGNYIWFAHDMDYAGYPTVRYGAISIANNSATTAMAYHSGTSDDFNPSIGIGVSPTGGDYIYVNWAYSDTPNGVPISDTVDSVAANGGVPDLIGTGVVLVTGATTLEGTYDDYSSVSIDPTVPAGSCAVTTQHYFASGGSWATRVARVGSC